MFILRVAAVIVMALAAAAPASAQMNAGELSGVVRDPSGGVLPGATVSASQVDSGLTLERVTDGEGRFYFASLQIGEWEVTVSMPGFRPVVQTGILLEIGRNLELQYTLELGQVTEAVVVTAPAPLLQLTTAEISDVIESRQVDSIPLNGRQFLQLAQLSPAVVIPPSGTRGAALQQAGALPNVGGQRAGHNIYLLDGVKVTDELFNNLVINPSVDSISEFKIQKSMYPPEFGGKASALINVATKSGYNAFSGSAFAFLRDERFDAHNYFDPPDEPVPPLDQGQYGGTVGGPIARDRTFFFVSFEGQRTDRSLTQTFSVPSPAVRGGDFSGHAPLCDPLSRDPRSGACGSFFPGNRIPATRIDPIATTLLAHTPLPNGPGEVQNLTAVETLDRNIDQFSARIDQRLGLSDQLFVRFSTFDALELQPFGTGVLQETLVPGFGRTLATETRNLAVSYTRAINNRMLNELRFGWMRVGGGQRSLNAGNDFAARAGLLGVTADPRDAGFPQISTGGLYSVMGDPTTFVHRNNEHFELYENLLIDRGHHHLKFGAYLFHLRFRPENPDTARGAFSYTGQFSGNALGDFLLGYPVAARSGIGGRGAEDGRTTWFHTYAQDDWRVRDDLTLNFGLRYEINQHMRDVENRLSTIDLSVPGGRYVIASDAQGNISPAAHALLPLIPIPWVASSEIGWDNSLLRPSKKRFAPRLGVAWTPGDGADVVVRGGYGIFLNQWAYSVQTAFARNLPFFYLKQVDVPIEQRVPQLETRDILTADATGTIGGSIMDYDYQVEYTQTWSGGVQAELLPGHGVRGVLHGVVHDRGGQLDDPQRARARTRTAGAAPGRAGARGHSRDTLRRQVDLPRRDVQGGPPAARRRLVRRRLYAVAIARRRLEPGRHRVRGQRAAGRAQHLSGRERALQLRPPPPVRRQRHVRAAVPARPRRLARGCARQLARDRRGDAAVGCSVHGEPDRGPGEHRRRTGPAARSPQGPQSARRTADSRSLVRHRGIRAAGAVHLRQRRTQPGVRPGPGERGHRRTQALVPGRRRRSGIPLGGVQPAQPGQLRPPEPLLRLAELRPHLQLRPGARDAVRPALSLLEGEA